MRVIIYPLADIFYYSFYIEGLYRLYGKKNVSFCKKKFPAFPERTFAAVIKGDEEIKIAIDAIDSTKINPELLQWCDVYGKVNLNEAKLPEEGSEKIIAIGPSFGIKIWNLLETFRYSFSNWYKSRRDINFKRNFFASYWRQYRRASLNEYDALSQSTNCYIFFMSSLWEKERETNSLRNMFITACKEISTIQFEGGFAPRPDGKDLGFADSIDDRLDIKEYLRKIKRSTVVFNTPAVQKCHGWKLAEFLAMGKAIISTEHANVLPEPLIHGKHLHYVPVEKQVIKKGIEKISSEPEYRTHLENNARSYYTKNLAPEIVVKKLILIIEEIK